MEGPQVDLDTLISWMKFENNEDYRKYLQRLRNIPTLVRNLYFFVHTFIFIIVLRQSRNFGFG